MNTKKQLTVSDVEWELVPMEETASIDGNCMASGDDDYDAQVAQQIEDSLRAGNEWAWCCVKLTGRWKGLEASDFLGCCSYRDAAEFMQPDGYYQDMQNTVLEQLQEMAEDIADGIDG